MKVASIIDNYLASPHGNRQGLSYGELAVLLVTYIVSEADHRICCLEKWVREHQRSLEGITEWEIREKEATDDRCGDLLRTLGRTETQTQMEMSLSQHLVKAYELPTKQARSDTTSFSVYHQISEDGIEYSIEKKISYKKVYKGRGSRSENSSYRRVRQINLILNYERLSTEIESFKTLAGWRLYVTNATNKRLSLTEAVSAYKEQWQPEQGFHRFKKGRLSALPIYFRDEEKIKGLMFLLTIALRVFTLMEFVVRRQLHQC
jgi:transposase